jgi:hypothetical protein
VQIEPTQRQGGHAHDTRSSLTPKEGPIMFQFDGLCGDATMALDTSVASIARHSDRSNRPESPTSQDVRL